MTSSPDDDLSQELARLGLIEGRPIRPQFYILEHHTPVPLDDIVAWARWKVDSVAWRVARSQVADVEISTVFLGLDYNFTYQGPPMLFETMVFKRPGVGDVVHEYTRRYPTWDEAEAGHAEVVTEVLAARRDAAP